MCGLILFMFFMVVLGWVLLSYNVILGLVCWLVPLGFVCWWISESMKDRKRANNRRELIDLLVKYIKNNGIIYATTGDSGYMIKGITFKTKYQEMFFCFNDYGYVNITRDEIAQLLTEIEKKTNGYLRDNKKMGRHDERFGDPPNRGDGIELFFGQAAIYQRNMDDEYKRKRQNLKRI